MWLYLGLYQILTRCLRLVPKPEGNFIILNRISILLATLILAYDLCMFYVVVRVTCLDFQLDCSMLYNPEEGGLAVVLMCNVYWALTVIN